MTLHPAVVVHGLDDALEALTVGRPVTLLSARGAALYAGCLWWREMVTRARAAHPAVPALDILDCADAPGRAIAAIRIGQRILILAQTVPGFHTVAAITAARGLILLADRPPALDLADPGALRRLPAWLASA
jgi:hypothetical protein